MPKKATQPPSSKRDLQKVRELHVAGKLDECVARLDPDHVSESMKKVPAGVVRLLTSLLQLKSVDKRVDSLTRDEREPAKALLRSAREHQGVQFVEALLKAAKEDSQLAESIGLKFADQKAEDREKLIENRITQLTHRPILMLQSRRLYAAVDFFRDDEIIFKSDMELDHLIGLAADLLDVAKNCLAFAQINAPKVELNLNAQACQTGIKHIRKSSREIRACFEEGGPKKNTARRKSVRKSPKKAR